MGLTLGQLHLKVRSASIAAFRILSAILPLFVWMSSKNFSFFNVSYKSLSFITWNLIEYVHIQNFQRATAHLNVWANFLLFYFVYGCKTIHKNILTESKSRKLDCVLLMSCTRFRVNPHSIVAWLSRNSLLKAGTKSEV